MRAEARRKQLLSLLKGASSPVSAAVLAKALHVSRQIIVSDVALLRASGTMLIATPRGYLLQHPDTGVTRQIACVHDAAGMRAELNAIVDQGCKVLDVIIEHPVYGQLSGMLQLSTRDDVEQFLVRCARAQPLSYLTGGLHLHTLLCPSEEAFARAKEQLNALKILLSDD